MAVRALFLKWRLKFFSNSYRVCFSFSTLSPTLCSKIFNQYLSSFLKSGKPKVTISSTILSWSFIAFPSEYKIIDFSSTLYSFSSPSERDPHAGFQLFCSWLYTFYRAGHHCVPYFKMLFSPCISIWFCFINFLLWLPVTNILFYLCGEKLLSLLWIYDLSRPLIFIFIVQLNLIVLPFVYSDCVPQMCGWFSLWHYFPQEGIRHEIMPLAVRVYEVK